MPNLSDVMHYRGDKEWQLITDGQHSINDFPCPECHRVATYHAYEIVDVGFKYICNDCHSASWFQIWGDGGTCYDRRDNVVWP